MRGVLAFEKESPPLRRSPRVSRQSSINDCYLAQCAMTAAGSGPSPAAACDKPAVARCTTRAFSWRWAYRPLSAPAQGGASRSPGKARIQGRRRAPMRAIGPLRAQRARRRTRRRRLRLARRRHVVAAGRPGRDASAGVGGPRLRHGFGHDGDRRRRERHGTRPLACRGVPRSVGREPNTPKGAVAIIVASRDLRIQSDLACLPRSSRTSSISPER